MLFSWMQDNTRFPFFFCNLFILQDIFLSSFELHKTVEHKNLNQTNSIRGDQDNERKRSHSGKN